MVRAVAHDDQATIKSTIKSTITFGTDPEGVK